MCRQELLELRNSTCLALLGLVLLTLSSCTKRGPLAEHSPTAPQLVEIAPTLASFPDVFAPGAAHVALLKVFSEQARKSGRIDAVCAEFLEGRALIAPEYMAMSAAQALPECRFACLPDFDDLSRSAEPWTVVLRDCPDPQRAWVGDLESAKNKAWWVDYLLIRGAFGAIEAELQAQGQAALWPRYRKVLPALAASMVQWQIKQSAPLSESPPP